jgi:hypothetical protein
MLPESTAFPGHNSILARYSSVCRVSLSMFVKVYTALFYTKVENKRVSESGINQSVMLLSSELTERTMEYAGVY